MALDNDLLAELVKQQKMQNVLINAYLEHQVKEARQVPGVTRLRTFALKNPTAPALAIQMISKDMNRDSVGIQNNGPGDVILQTDWFDPASVLQHFVDLGTTPLTVNSAIPIAFLASGSSLAIDGTGAIWGYNLNSASEAATLSFAESLYVTSEPLRSVAQHRLMMNDDGLTVDELPGGGALR